MAASGAKRAAARRRRMPPRHRAPRQGDELGRAAASPVRRRCRRPSASRRTGCQCQPRHTDCTLIRWPVGTRGWRSPAGGPAHTRNCPTSACCSSGVSQARMWATSGRGRVGCRSAGSMRTWVSPASRSRLGAQRQLSRTTRAGRRQRRRHAAEATAPHPAPAGRDVALIPNQRSAGRICEVIQSIFSRWSVRECASPMRRGR